MGRKVLATLAATITLSLSQSSAEASYPSGYYDSLNGKCGSELMHAVRDLCIDHTVISYGTNTWNAFLDTDIKTVGGTDYWWDMYSNELVTVSSGHPGLNIEHSVANSWWGGTKNDAYKDIVHLNPSNQDANSRKSNYPICELGSVSWTNGVTSVGSPKSGQGGGSSNGYEPCDEYKGDFARVFMYMFAVYEDLNWSKTWMINKATGTMFAEWARQLVMRWHAADPVSQKERDRNDGIYRNQHNRNPFIDLPELADHIWGTKKTEPYGSGDPVPPNPSHAEEDDYEWLSAASADIDEGWTFETISAPSASTGIWRWKTYNGKSYLNGSAYIDGAFASEAYAFGPEIDMDRVLTAELSFEHAAKFQTTCRELCTVAVRDCRTDETSLIAIPRWPAAGTWTFTESGPIDLSSYAGRKIRVGFRYASTDAGADTWEINNMHLSLLRSPLASAAFPSETESDGSEFVEVWGNNILVPEGSLIFDLNGRICDGHNLMPGIYLVTNPSFRKTVKAAVR